MVMRKLRTKMKLFLWFAATIFIGFIFLEWGMQFTTTRRLSPRERGIIGEVNGEPLFYSGYSNLLEYHRRQGIEPWKSRELAFNMLVEEGLLNQEIERRKIKITDEEVVEVIKNNPPPALLEDTMLQTDGKFDYNKYQAIISDPANIRWLESYEAVIRNQVPRQILYQVITSAVRPTTIDLVDAYIQENLKVKLEYALIQKTEDSAQESEILEYYNAHREEFRTKESPIIEYVVFDVPVTLEDEIYIEETAKEIFELAQEGAPLDSLAMEYGCKLLESDVGTVSLQGPIKKGDGYHILKEDKDLLVPIRPSDESFARVEDRAMGFIEVAGSGFDEAAQDYELELHKLVASGWDTMLKGVDISYIDLSQNHQLIGPIEGPNCFYVLHTLGVQESHIPDFSEIEEEVRNKYLQSQSKALAENLLIEIRNVPQTNFREFLSANRFDVKARELSIKDTVEVGDLFFKSINIPKDGVAIIESDNGFYLVHCLEREEPGSEEIEEAIPEFNARWMAEERERIYAEWFNNLKQTADIKDYRYRIQ